jgi:hypothetical protein
LYLYVNLKTAFIKQEDCMVRKKKNWVALIPFSIIMTIFVVGMMPLSSIYGNTINTPLMVSAGGSHSIALKNDGTVWVWGKNDQGQLGNGTTNDHPLAIQVDGLYNIIAVAAGRSHSVALSNDGTVWAWGRNSDGMLGDGTRTRMATTPVQVHNINDAIAISAGSFHTVALKNDGTVWAWGHNIGGELGDGTYHDMWIPTQVIGAKKKGFLNLNE